MAQQGPPQSALVEDGRNTHGLARHSMDYWSGGCSLLSLLLIFLAELTDFL